MTRALTVELETEQFDRLQAEAERRGMSPSDFAGKLIAERLPSGDSEERREWSGLSARSFARDWDSEEDQAYDPLPHPSPGI